MEVAAIPSPNIAMLKASKVIDLSDSSSEEDERSVTALTEYETSSSDGEANDTGLTIPDVEDGEPEHESTDLESEDEVNVVRRARPSEDLPMPTQTSHLHLCQAKDDRESVPEETSFLEQAARAQDYGSETEPFLDEDDKPQQSCTYCSYVTSLSASAQQHQEAAD